MMGHKRTIILCVLLVLAGVAATAQESLPPCTGEWQIGGGAMDAMGDADGNVYVVDHSNNRVLKFDENGTLLQTWVQYFNNPRGLAIDSQGFVYVGSWNSGEIHKFDANGNLVHSWISSGAMYVAVDSDDNVWLTSFGENRVRKFDPEGELLLEWKGVSSPRGIAVDSAGNVYVAEQGANRVRKFDQSGNPLFVVGSIFAWDVAVDGNDNVYLAESTRVFKFDSEGNFLAEWSGCDTGVNVFKGLRGIGADDRGGVYVADWGGGRVSTFGSLAPEFSCVGFETPMASGTVTARGNRALPLKAQLFDADGYEMTDLELVAPPVLQVKFKAAGGAGAVDVTDDVLPAGQSTEGNEFEYNLADGVWQFNLKTKNYSAGGTYTITIVSGDNSEYIIDPTCEAKFGRDE
jgi:streptogramin lyase